MLIEYINPIYLQKKVLEALKQDLYNKKKVKCIVLNIFF